MQAVDEELCAEAIIDGESIEDDTDRQPQHHPGFVFSSRMNIGASKCQLRIRIHFNMHTGSVKLLANTTLRPPGL